MEEDGLLKNLVCQGVASEVNDSNLHPKGKTNMGVQTWFNLNQLNRLIQMTVLDWLSYPMNINRGELWMAILNILSIPSRIKVLENNLAQLVCY